jgi:hypothetical protein
LAADGAAAEADSSSPDSTFAFGANAPPAPDPFDPASLRISQDLSAALGVREVLTIPHRKPSPEWFFRVHPSPDYALQTYVVELREDDETYLVNSNLWPALHEDMKIGATFGPRMIFTAVNRQGVTFLWLCKLPGPDGKIPDYVSVPLAAAAARTAWVKPFWDQSQKRHRFFQSDCYKNEPDWPDLPLRELLQRSFKDYFIDSTNHPVLRRLRGEV